MAGAKIDAPAAVEIQRSEPAPARPLRTYAHLVDLPRKPTRYDIATSALDFHAGSGDAAALPMGDGNRQDRAGSPLHAATTPRLGGGVRAPPPGRRQERGTRCASCPSAAWRATAGARRSWR